MIGVLFLITGTLFGSFANVCILRLPKNENIIFKSSYCPECNNKIDWLNNMPIISYVILRGHSKCCNKKISIQYPLVEFFLGILFLLNYILFDLSQAILLSGFFFLITIVIVIDFNKQIIFDIFPYIIIVFGLLITFFFPTLNPFQVGILNSLFSVVISFTLFLTIRKVFKKVKKKEGLGLGDAKLVAALSAWTGFEYFLYLLIISSLIGIIYYFIVKKKRSQEVRIPFGSALGIGFIILLLY